MKSWRCFWKYASSGNSVCRQSFNYSWVSALLWLETWMLHSKSCNSPYPSVHCWWVSHLFHGTMVHVSWVFKYGSANQILASRQQIAEPKKKISSNNCFGWSLPSFSRYVFSFILCSLRNQPSFSNMCCSKGFDHIHCLPSRKIGSLFR